MSGCCQRPYSPCVLISARIALKYPSYASHAPQVPTVQEQCGASVNSAAPSPWLTPTKPASFDSPSHHSLYLCFLYCTDCILGESTSSSSTLATSKKQTHEFAAQTSDYQLHHTTTFRPHYPSLTRSSTLLDGTLCPVPAPSMTSSLSQFSPLLYSRLSYCYLYILLSDHVTLNTVQFIVQRVVI